MIKQEMCPALSLTVAPLVHQYLYSTVHLYDQAIVHDFWDPLLVFFIQ